MRKRYLLLFLCFFIVNALQANCIADAIDNSKISSTAYSRQYQKQPKRVNYVNNSNINLEQLMFISVPADYPIPFVITEEVSSEDTSSGQQVEIRVDKDIYVNNVLVFKKGANGTLLIKSVKPARNLGKGGYIIFTKGYVKDTTGTLREISFRKKYSGKRCQWAGIIGHAMIWNPVGWVVGLKEGEPISIPAGTEGVATLKNGFQINKKI